MAKLTHAVALAFLASYPVAALAQQAGPAAEVSKVSLSADNIYVDEAENTVTAEGNVEATYEGRVLTAERLIYNRNTNRVRATGNVVIFDPDGSQRFAEEIETDSALSDGYAVGFSTRIPGGGTATAASAVREDGGAFNALDKIVYTACELCEGDRTPTWAIRARRAILNQDTQMMSYQDAVLEIAGVPVIYLPYFAHPDPTSGRRSGFLAPDFGTSGKYGVFFQQPYYWAISPYQDLTIAPQIMGRVNPLMEMEYRKRFWSGALRANFSFTEEQDFDSDGEKFDDNELRGHIFASGKFQVSPKWQWGFGVEQVSDDLYTTRYDISGEGEKRGLYASQPRRLLNQVFAVGQGSNWYADAALLSINGLRANDDDDTLPVASPLAFAERNFDFGDYGFLSVNASSAILTRQQGVDSRRVSLGSDWSTTQVLPGGLLLEPFAEARYDNYQLDDLASSVDSVDRGVANVGAKLSYPLFRPGKSVDIIVEPTIMAAQGTSNTNNPNIPLEDGLFYEFDETALFDANGYAGFDLYEGGAKASAGISTTALWKNGVSLSAMGGRRWRNSSDPFLSVPSNLDGTVSDWVAGLSADLGAPLKLETRVRLDDEDFDLNRIDAGIRTNWWRLRGSLRYYKLDESVTVSGLGEEGVSMSGDVRLTDQYYFVYGRQRDIRDDRDIRHTFGVAYEDDCSRFQITFERSEAIDRTIGPNDSVKFAFSFKTLGQFGSNDVD